MSFTINVDSVVLELRLYIKRLEDAVPLYDFVGKYAVDKVRERIESTKEDPNGNPWEPWSSMTTFNRTLKGNSWQGINWDTGALLDSIRFDVDGSFDVSIGSDLDYALTVQEGDVSTNQPAREFLGWAQEDYAVIERAAITYFLEGVPL